MPAIIGKIINTNAKTEINHNNSAKNSIDFFITILLNLFLKPPQF
jgi:hypothetical protein